MRLIILFLFLYVACAPGERKVFEILINEGFDSSKPIKSPFNIPLQIKATNWTSNDIIIGFNIDRTKGRAYEVSMDIEEDMLIMSKGFPLVGENRSIGYDTIPSGKSNSYPFLFHVLNTRYTSPYLLYIFIYCENNKKDNCYLNPENGEYEGYIVNIHNEGYLEFFQVTAVYKDYELLPIPFSKKDKLQYPIVSTKDMGVTVNEVGQYVYSDQSFRPRSLR